MTVDRSHYQDWFEDLPNWPCPRCFRGHLLLDEGSLQTKETGPSIRSRNDHPDWDPQMIEERFAGLLVCNYARCGEVSAIYGSSGVDESVEQDYDGSWQQKWVVMRKPQGISPAPIPIRMPKELPEEIACRLKEASGLIWQAPEAAGNQLRQAVESLMDDRRVRKTEVSDRKRRLSLHRRIKEFEKADPNNAELLLAIKWLGNSGSHPSGLSRKDVLDAFDMIELVMVDLYDNSAAEIRSKAKAINRRKGPA